MENLKKNLAECRSLSYNYGRGLVNLRDENYDIAEFVMFLESRLEEKDEELHEVRGRAALLQEQMDEGEKSGQESHCRAHGSPIKVPASEANLDVPSWASMAC